jgi:L-lysine 2,3-aminomutase
MAVFTTSNDRGRAEAAESHDAGWEAVLADAIRDPAELCHLLDLPPGLGAEVAQAAGDFPLLVPRPYLARIRPGDPDDPLLRQVLPRAVETAPAPGFGPDPLGETAASCTSGVLRKYQGRLLILASRACGVHCRFCFRRHWRHGTDGGGLVEADSSIHEVILSGGDPLVLPDSVLAEWVERLAGISHLRRLRIHTRLPVVIPQRVTASLLDCLRRTRLATVVVVHVNHPREIDAAVAMALGRLVDAGVPVLSQSVLLRGVNDDPDVLVKLYERLIDLRVLPYYLHQLDRVAGSAHFEVHEQRGIELIRAIRDRLPGYAVPRYVRDLPGLGSKQPLA